MQSVRDIILAITAEDQVELNQVQVMELTDKIKANV